MREGSREEIGAVNLGTGREEALRMPPRMRERQNLCWWGRPMKQPPFTCLLGPITAAYGLRLNIRAGTLQQWMLADLLSPFPNRAHRVSCRNAEIQAHQTGEGTNLASARKIGSIREAACLPIFMLYIPYLRAQSYY
jgi:hypothetical protein